MIAPQTEPVQSAARGALHLWGDYSLADPQFLALLPIALLLLWWGRSSSARAAGRVSVLPAAPERSLRQRFLWLPALLRALALVLAVVAMARPLRGNVQHDVVSEGVDIVLLVDRSGSMQHEDLEPGRSRLAVVKDVVGDFAQRRMTDRVGAADNVALIGFARFPTLLCPFTLDVEAIRGFLEELELARHREEDGTAIGVALTKAVAVLRESDAKSRIVVLLTDGQNTVSDIAPLDAAELAAEEGVRVYAIYAARYVFDHDPFRNKWVPLDVQVDTSELEAIAETTGGRFYRARDKQGLEGIYSEIESLERTERRELRFEETFDLYPWLLLPAVVGYVLAWLSMATWARRLP